MSFHAHYIYAGTSHDSVVDALSTFVFDWYTDEELPADGDAMLFELGAAGVSLDRIVCSRHPADEADWLGAEELDAYWDAALERARAVRTARAVRQSFDDHYASESVSNGVIVSALLEKRGPVFVLETGASDQDDVLLGEAEDVGADILDFCEGAVPLHWALHRLTCEIAPDGTIGWSEGAGERPWALAPEEDSSVAAVALGVRDGADTLLALWRDGEQTVHRLGALAQPGDSAAQSALTRIAQSELAAEDADAYASAFELAWETTWDELQDELNIIVELDFVAGSDRSALLADMPMGSALVALRETELEYVDCDACSPIAADRRARHAFDMTGLSGYEISAITACWR